MPLKRTNVPEHIRRAIRLAISVGIAAATGFSLLEPLGGWHSRWGSQTMMGTKWAAITSVVCNAPVIAKTTEVAMERVLGTVTGGMLGYGLAIVNDTLPFLDQPFFTVIVATVVAFMSIILGYKLRLDYSGRLFIMTFILVAMAAPKTADAFIVAVTRISGIIFGVITTMVMSVVVFPKSASHQATDNLQAGLAALARLNAVAWQRGDGCTAAQDMMRPPQTAVHAQEAPATHVWRPQRRDSDQDSMHLLIEDSDSHSGSVHTEDACCDEALSEVYARMSVCQDFTSLSKSETYVFTSRGRWCLVPAFKCLPWRTALPDAEMSQVIAASRKVARLLWCLHTSLPEAMDSPVLDQYHGAIGFLSNLGDSLQVYIENLAAAFPNQHSLEASQLYSFIEGVETLIAASHRASCDSTILLQSVCGMNGGSRAAHKTADPYSAVSRNASPRRAASLPVPEACNRSVAFICDTSGLVTRITAGPNNLHAPDFVPGARDAKFSPVSEVLPKGSQTDDLLRAAASSNGHPWPHRNGTTMDEYLSQVRWQATQFLLRRLARELIVLHTAFVKLSALLPPTRWESRRRKWQQKSEPSLEEPLLHGRETPPPA